MGNPGIAYVMAGAPTRDGGYQGFFFCYFHHSNFECTAVRMRMGRTFAERTTTIRIDLRKLANLFINRITGWMSLSEDTAMCLHSPGRRTQDTSFFAAAGQVHLCPPVPGCHLPMRFFLFWQKRISFQDRFTLIAFVTSPPAPRTIVTISITTRATTVGSFCSVPGLKSIKLLWALSPPREKWKQISFNNNGEKIKSQILKEIFFSIWELNLDK